MSALCGVYFVESISKNMFNINFVFFACRLVVPSEVSSSNDEEWSCQLVVE